MDKSKAIEIFGGRAETATAIGISVQAISDWPEVLPQRIADRVIAAAYRHGKLDAIPKGRPQRVAKAA